MIDVADKDLKLIRRILKKHISDRHVSAFGSRVQGTAKPFSDLDLAVMGEKPLELSVLSALQYDFSESDLPYRIDLVDWATTSPEFREMIASQAQEIYAPTH